MLEYLIEIISLITSRRTYLHFIISVFTSRRERLRIPAGYGSKLLHEGLPRNRAACMYVVYLLLRWKLKCTKM